MPDSRSFSRSFSARSFSARSFSVFKIAKSSLHYRRSISLAVVLGIAIATAVITGALLVGDSMRGSLRGLTLQRLGKTDSLIAPGTFFKPAEILPPETSVALMYFPSGIAETKTAEGKTRRAGGVQIIGCDQDFWDLDTSGMAKPDRIDDQSVILNQSAAAELGVQAGDTVTIRLPVEQAVPADSPLGRRDTQSEGLPRMKVARVIPDKGLGRFGITASQAPPQNVYLNREVVSETLQREGQANLLLSTVAVDSNRLQPSLTDLGLSLREIKQTFKPKDEGESGDDETVFQYYSLTSDRLLLPNPVVEHVRRELGDASAQPIATYLANAIETTGNDGKPVASVPYSTLTAIDDSDSLPLNYALPKGTAADGVVPMVINSWAARQLSAEVGTPLKVLYYEPEVDDGQEVERHFDAVVTEVVPVTKPSRPFRRSREAVFTQRPTRYNDPDLTPLVPGVTDQDSISDWDLPFQLDREISREDDAYWNNYRLTPKAFIPLKDGKRLFGSRFGEITGLRIDHDIASDRSELEERTTTVLNQHLNEIGWSPIEIRKQQLKASNGTTPFDGLFLALSFFVIASAILLISMLVRLGLIARTREIGTLMATGWTPAGARRLLMTEGMIIASLGVVVGVLLGIAYAMIVLYGLRTWWVGAVTVPFLEFHWTPVSLVVGAAAGWFIATGTIWFTTRSLLRRSPQTLLSGRDSDADVARSDQTPTSTRRGGTRTGTGMGIGKAAGTAMGLAVICAIVGFISTGPAAAGAFVAGGMLWLITCLLVIYRKLHWPKRMVARGDSNADSESKSDRFSVGTLASRNATRNPLRSTLTIGLMASAAFLILSTTAFQLRPDDSGIGGFELIATSSQPFFDNLDDPATRSETFGPDQTFFSDATIAALRLKPGQDAGCNNLYRAARPTVLGIKPGFGVAADSGKGFSWAGFQNGKITERSPWDLLHIKATGGPQDPIPVVLDQNTAMWSLQMYGGVGEETSFEFEPGKPVHFKVVGLLMNSVLQGKLVIGESNFETVFPDVNGYRFFMVDCDKGKKADVSETLESRLGDIGMDVSDSAEVLSGMMAVQNTYLRTFQSLGGLGLLLGTIGLAISQVRSVLERQRELAVMQAIGFTRRKLSTAVMTETATLLILGIGCGVVCAILAVLPHALSAGITPPIVEPLIWIVLIVCFGMVAGFIAVGRVSRLKLLDSLRAD